jgi:hypothetical protein
MQVLHSSTIFLAVVLAGLTAVVCLSPLLELVGKPWNSCCCCSPTFEIQNSSVRNNKAQVAVYEIVLQRIIDV